MYKTLIPDQNLKYFLYIGSMEIWKDIDGFGGRYQVSNLGRIRSIGGITWKTDRILKTEIGVGGYVRVGLFKDNKQKHYRVHRLVAQAFITNPDNLPEVNHIDENKLNNRVENLEWCTSEYNHNYGTINQRVAQNQSKRIECIETGEIFNSVKDCKQAGYNHCDQVCRGERNVCKGYHFRYI